MFWWQYATADQVYQELAYYKPRPDNFEEWVEEEEAMAEQIWAVAQELTDNPWAQGGG